jgi:hypothetical protein
MPAKSGTWLTIVEILRSAASLQIVSNLGVDRQKSIETLAVSGRNFPAFILHLLIGPVLQFLEQRGLDHHKAQARSSADVGPH